MTESLLNTNQLAAAIGRGPVYVWLMKRHGYRFLYGMRTTQKHALAWLAEHPEFRATQVKKSPKRTPKGLSPSIRFTSNVPKNVPEVGYFRLWS